jgi:hypothetical protein
VCQSPYPLRSGHRSCPAPGRSARRSDDACRASGTKSHHEKLTVRLNGHGGLDHSHSHPATRQSVPRLPITASAKDDVTPLGFQLAAPAVNRNLGWRPGEG